MSMPSTIVAPGNDTNLYHLVFGGLQKGVEWQDIKDFARSHDLDVDHVEIHENALGGWVRVFGHDRYLLACKIFTGAVINGMALQVDTRNDTQPINLRVLARRSPQIPKTLAESSYPVDMYSPSVANYDFGTQPYQYPQQYYDYTPQPYALPQEYVSQHIDLDPPTPFNSQIPSTMFCESASGDGNTNASIPRQVDQVVEFRKVIIKKLMKNTTQSGLVELIKWALSQRPFRPDWIEEVELPLDRNGKFRGYAYAYMATHEIANILVYELDGQAQQGAKTPLEVTLAVEGAPPVGDRQRKHSSSSKASSRKSSHSHKANSKSSDERDGATIITPAIANGSGSGSGKHSKR